MPTGYCHVLYMDTHTVVDIEVQWQERDPCRVKQLAKGADEKDLKIEVK